LKILGRVEIFEGEKAAEWLPRVRMPQEKTPIERVLVIHVEAYDWNCPQHITPRYTESDIAVAVSSLTGQIAKLEAENQKLRAQIAARADAGQPA
jgi:uncharacterized protein